MGMGRYSRQIRTIGAIKHVVTPQEAHRHCPAASSERPSTSSSIVFIGTNIVLNRQHWPQREKQIRGGDEHQAFL